MPAPEPSRPSDATRSAAVSAQPAVPGVANPGVRWRLTPKGMVRDLAATEIDRVMASVGHLWMLSIVVVGPFAVLVPFLIWLFMRRRSQFVADHMREVMNAQLTVVLLLCIVCVGWVLLVPWTVIWLISAVRGAVAAGGGEIFRYPVVLRIIP